MAIKTAGALLERDVKLESSKLSRQAAKLSKAKSGGAGIGGLLGAIAGVALAPFTGGASLLMAGIGGGLGALAGSKIAGSAAGGQESLMGGQFMQGSRHDIADQIAQQEGMDVLMAAGTGMFQAGNISKGIGVFKEGFATGAAKGGLFGGVGKGILQGSADVGKHLAKDLFKDFADPKKEKVAGLTKEALSEGATANIMDIMKITNPVGGVKKGGIGKIIGGIGDAASNIYGGTDKLLGGILPDIGGAGQPIGEGWISGLLGPKMTGQSNYSGDNVDLSGGLGGTGYDDVSYDMSSPDLSEQDFAAQHAVNVQENVGINLDQPDFSNHEWVKQFQMRVMNMKEGDPGWGMFDSATTNAYRQWAKNKQGN